MELSNYMKSVIDMDRAAVVICDLSHKIIYMNPAAVKNYKKYGGEMLMGKNLLDCHNKQSKVIIEKVVAWFEESAENNMIYTYYNKKEKMELFGSVGKA